MTLPIGLTWPHNDDYLVTESIMSMELANPELKVSTCIVKPKGKMTIWRVVNSADYPLILTKGQILALCYRVPPTYAIEVSYREIDVGKVAAPEISVQNNRMMSIMICSNCLDTQSKQV